MLGEQLQITRLDVKHFMIRIKVFFYIYDLFLLDLIKHCALI